MRPRSLPLLITIAAAMMTVACHDATPPALKDGELVKPGDGNAAGNGNGDENNPGENPAQPDEAELADAGERYVGPGFTLKYADGGVMIVKRGGGGGYAFFDIDGNRRVEFSLGAADGARFTGARLAVNGKDVAEGARLLKSDGATRWIAFDDEAAGALHLIVLKP